MWRNVCWRNVHLPRVTSAGTRQAVDGDALAVEAAVAVVCVAAADVVVGDALHAALRVVGVG